MAYDQKLVKLRKENGYTQEQLGEMLGVSRQAISRWEAGETMPEAALIVKLCDIYKVSADYILRDDFTSDDDAPAVKRKSEELSSTLSKNKKLRLFSAVGFIVAAVCAVILAITSNSGQQLVVSSVWAVFAAGAAVFYLLRR